MARNNVQVTISAVDKTAAAFKAAERNMERLVSGAKRMGGIFLGAFGLGFTAQKISRFFQESARSAAEADDKIRLRMQYLGDSFERLKVNVGKALLGDAGFVNSLDRLVSKIEIDLVPALATLVGWIGKLGGALDKVDPQRLGAVVNDRLFGEFAEAVFGTPRRGSPGPNQDFSDVSSGSSSQAYRLRLTEAELAARARAQREAYERWVAQNRDRSAQVLFGDTSQQLDPGIMWRNMPEQELVGTLIPDPQDIAERLDRALTDPTTGIGASMERMGTLAKLHEEFTAQVAGTVVDAFTTGIEMAVMTGNIGEGFKALIGVLLSGLGDAAIKFGTGSLMIAINMDRIQKALAALNPAAAIAASVAMIAGGAVLKGLAGRVFGSMGTTQAYGAVLSGRNGSLAAGADLGGQGQLTIVMPREAFMKADDPAVQEFIAECISRGVGRNITFRPA